IAIVVPKPRGDAGGGRIRAAAVRRNRLKRRLREIARASVLPELNGRDCRVDVLVRARPEAYGATFGELRAELLDVEEWLCSHRG
ncbi:MAG: ribonuclease P protein component, partial [Gemmatimonadota bacterium]